MNQKKMSVVTKLILSAALVIGIIVSMTVIAPHLADPETHRAAIERLDEAKNNVMGLAAASTTASIGVSMLPSDIGNAVSGELADLSTYFMLILCAIYLEKYLLTLTGMAAFKILVPVGLLFLGLFIWWRHDGVKRMCVKFLAAGLLVWAIIPASTYVSASIQHTYESSINTIIEEAEEIEAETDVYIEGAIDGEVKSDVDTEVETEAAGTTQITGIRDLLNVVKEKVHEAAESVTEAASDAANGLSATASETLKKAEQLLTRFIEAIAVMIITSCVLPLLVMVFFFWLIRLAVERPISIVYPALPGKKNSER